MFKFVQHPEPDGDLYDDVITAPSNVDPGVVMEKAHIGSGAPGMPVRYSHPQV